MNPTSGNVQSQIQASIFGTFFPRTNYTTQFMGASTTVNVPTTWLNSTVLELSIPVLGYIGNYNVTLLIRSSIYQEDFQTFTVNSG